MAKDLEKDEEKREAGTSTGRRPSDLTAAESSHDGDNESIDTTLDRQQSSERHDGLHDEEAGIPVRSRSRASSTRSRAVTIVPRFKRRGLLAQLAIIPEVERPYEYTNRVKWTITTIIAIAAATAPMGSAIFYPALPAMTEEFGSSPTIVNLSVALYMLSMSIFPLWWSSFSETLGRRNIYLVSFLMSIVFSILSAVSVNVPMLIVMRMLSGGAAASVQAVGAGTIADIWESRQRGRAMGMFYLGPLMGPLLAPVIGGALAWRFGWRSTMWLMTAYSILVTIMLLFCLPETLPKKPAARPEPLPTDPSTENLSRVSTTRSVQLRTKSAAAWFKRCFLDPLQIITYLRFPAVAITVYFAAITFGSLYVLNISVQSAFSLPPYSYSPLIVGLLYIPNSAGYFIASLLGGPWIDRIMIRAAEKNNRYDADGKLIYLPEDRMRENAWISATLYPGALIWYGWTVQNGVHLAAPLIANFFFGVGSMLVFSAATTMLTEFMPGRSSSGVALNNFVRNIFSCTGGIVTQPLIDVMGNGWLFTVLGLVAWISGNMCIWLLRKNSQKWRANMDKALNTP